MSNYPDDMKKSDYRYIYGGVRETDQCVCGHMEKVHEINEGACCEKGCCCEEFTTEE